MKLNRIKIVLAEKDKSNRWLAEHIDKSQVTISRWCNQVIQPSLKDLYKIAECLDIDVRDLLVSNKDDK